MNAAGIKFWTEERIMLDKLYADRLTRWQRLFDAYDLKFRDGLRDLRRTQYVKISEFVPVVRQVIGTVAMNYPHLFFEVTDDEAEGQDIEDILERSSSSLFEITDQRSFHRLITLSI